MRLPKRRSQMMRVYGAETPHLSAEALSRLKETLKRLESLDRPKIVVDLQHALSLGDFSENAEYHDAKHRLAKIDGRIFSMKERIKNVVVIESGSKDGVISLGSVVHLQVDGEEKTYTILGPQEADPSRNCISHLSPLGSALIGKKAKDVVEVHMPNGDVREYRVIDIS
ncbi:MAG: transcription elongation factor GreA [bacterium]|nr:transcription elongation factor GreA [bacterium]